MTSAGTARAVYLVLGMHRSGTSALTKALAALGPDLPAHTMPGDEHNEAGYFESWPIAVLNDQWLRAAHSAWDDPFAFPLEPLPAVLNEAWVRKASDLFDEEFGQAPRPLLKDPRISLLAPAWFELFDRRDIAVRNVISMRRPIAVAKSLQRRDGFALERGVLIWISYMLAAERHSRGRARIFVSYEQLLEDWRAQALRVAAAFGEEGLDASKLGQEEAVSKALRHHAGDDDLSGLGETGQLAARLTDWMERACADAAPPAEEIDAIAADFAALKRRLGGLVSPIARDLDQTRADLLFQRQLVDFQRNRLENEVRAVAAELHAVRAERDELARRLQAAPAADAPAAPSRVDIAGYGPPDQLIERFHRPEYREVWTALDPEFYLASYPDVRGFDPVAHYLEVGWREGRDPNPWFSTRAYLEAKPQLGPLGINPLVDYLRGGMDAPPKPRPPSAPVAPAARQSTSFDEQRAVVEPAFDRDYYLDLYVDIAQSGADPLTHYLESGWREGRDPSPAFSTRHYLEAYPEVADADINPLYHYLTIGRAAGYRPRPHLGWRYDILEKLQDVEARTAWAAKKRGPVEIRDPHILREALAGLAKAHLTVSHDDFTDKVGGVQLCIAREGAALREAGRAHIHIFPSVPAPVLIEDRDYPIAVLVEGRMVGDFRAGDVRQVAAEALAGVDLTAAIHNLLGHQADAVAEIVEAAAPSETFFWVHDFAAVCAGYTLLRNDVEFCGAPPVGSTACGLCIYGGHRVRHMEGYRRLFERLSPTLVSPSQAALDIWRKGGAPRAAVEIVHPHATLTPRGERSRRKGPVVVAFLGLPVSHKGWPAYRDLAAKVRGDERYEFYQLGDAPDPSAPVEFRRVAIAPDHLDAMYKAVEALQVDLVVIWSICPETFCLTAFEAQAGGAGLVAFADSGNAAAVTAATEAGVVLGSEAELVEFFASGRAAEIAEGRRRTLHDLTLSRMSADLAEAAGAARRRRDMGAR
ncbi:hypothetical protein ACFODL_10660 [Phenylobacterium terrae]|uniref:Glycosyl transferase family 1 domain-containing protein n=1 Tax=Phenylobacterium terrae TaxID=2665495 RepID=A0ABW4MYM3_9CAUL